MSDMDGLSDLDAMSDLGNDMDHFEETFKVEETFPVSKIESDSDTEGKHKKDADLKNQPAPTIEEEEHHSFAEDLDQFDDYSPVKSEIKAPATNEKRAAEESAIIKPTVIEHPGMIVAVKPKPAADVSSDVVPEKLSSSVKGFGDFGDLDELDQDAFDHMHSPRAEKSNQLRPKNSARQDDNASSESHRSFDSFSNDAQSPRIVNPTSAKAASQPPNTVKLNSKAAEEPAQVGRYHIGPNSEEEPVSPTQQVAVPPPSAANKETMLKRLNQFSAIEISALLNQAAASHEATTKELMRARINQFSEAEISVLLNQAKASHEATQKDTSSTSLRELAVVDSAAAFNNSEADQDHQALGQKGAFRYFVDQSRVQCAAPSASAGPLDTRPLLPDSELVLSHVYGYSGTAAPNLFYLSPHVLLYSVESLCVMHDLAALDGQTNHSQYMNQQKSTAGGVADPTTSQRFFQGHSELVMSLALHPSKTIVASGSRALSGAALLCVWEVATMRVLAELRFHSAGVAQLAFSPDGELLCSVGADESHTLALWAWRQKHLLAQSTVSPFVTQCVGFNPYWKGDGAQFVTGSGPDLHLWNLSSTVLTCSSAHTYTPPSANQQPTSSIQSPPDIRCALFLSPQTSGSASAGVGGRDQVDPNAAEAKACVCVCGTASGHLAVFERTRLAAPGYVPCHAATRGTPQGTLQGVTALCEGGGGGLILSAGADMKVKVWDRSLRLAFLFDIEKSLDFIFRAPGTVNVAGAAAAPPRSFMGREANPTIITSLAVVGSKVACGTSSSQVFQVDLQSREGRLLLSAPAFPVTGLDVHPTLPLFVTASARSLRPVRSHTRRLLSLLDGPFDSKHSTPNTITNPSLFAGGRGGPHKTRLADEDRAGELDGDEHVSGDGDSDLEADPADREGSEGRDRLGLLRVQGRGEADSGWRGAAVVTWDLHSHAMRPGVEDAFRLPAAVSALALSPCGSLVLLGLTNGALYVSRLHGPVVASELVSAAGFAVHGLRFAPNQTTLCVLCHKRVLLYRCVFDSNAPHPLLLHALHALPHAALVTAAQFSSDSAMLQTTAENLRMTWWSVALGQPLDLDAARDVTWASWDTNVGFSVQNLCHAQLQTAAGGVGSQLSNRPDDDLDHALFVQQLLRTAPALFAHKPYTLPPSLGGFPSEGNNKLTTSGANRGGSGLFRAKTLCVERSRNARVLAVGDALGRIKLLAFPCLSACPPARLHTGHASPVAFLAFAGSNDEWLLSASRGDSSVRGAIFQWRHLRQSEASLVRAQADSEATQAGLIRGVRASLRKQAFLLDSVSDALDHADRVTSAAPDFLVAGPNAHRPTPLSKDGWIGSGSEPRETPVVVSNDRERGGAGRRTPVSHSKSRGSLYPAVPGTRGMEVGVYGALKTPAKSGVSARLGRGVKSTSHTSSASRLSHGSKASGAGSSMSPFAAKPSATARVHGSEKVSDEKRAKLHALLVNLKQEERDLAKQLSDRRVELQRKSTLIKKLDKLAAVISGPSFKPKSQGPSAKQGFHTKTSAALREVSNPSKGGEAASAPEIAALDKLSHNNQELVAELKALESEVTGLARQCKASDHRSVDLQKLRDLKLALRKQNATDASRHSLEVYRQENFIKELLFTHQELEEGMASGERRLAELCEALESGQAQLGVLHDEYAALQRNLDALSAH